MSANLAVLIGRLVRDPELRKTQSGLSTTTFTVACDRYSKNNEDKADFILCQAWRQTADYIATYGKKGDLVSVIGSIQTDSYDDKDTGRKVYTTKVLANNVSILGGSRSKAEIEQADNSLDAPTIGLQTGSYGKQDSAFRSEPEEDLPF